MIAKIMKDTDFKGVVYYILNDNKGTEIIDAEGLFLENNDTIAQDFIGQTNMNPEVTKPVGHIALSFSKENALRLNKYGHGFGRQGERDDTEKPVGMCFAKRAISS